MDEISKEFLSFIIVFFLPLLIGLIATNIQKNKKHFFGKYFWTLTCTAGLALIYIMLYITNIIQPNQLTRLVFFISLITSGILLFIPWMSGSCYLLLGIINILGHIIQGIEEFWQQITRSNTKQ